MRIAYAVGVIVGFTLATITFLSGAVLPVAAFMVVSGVAMILSPESETGQ